MRGKLLVIGAVVVIGGIFGFIRVRPSVVGNVTAPIVTPVVSRYSSIEAINLVRLALGPGKCRAEYATPLFLAEFDAVNRIWLVGVSCSRPGDPPEPPLRQLGQLWLLHEDTGEVIPLTDAALQIMLPATPTPWPAGIRHPRCRPGHC